jgi:primosomal protein N' (replication factor Y)
MLAVRLEGTDAAQVQREAKGIGERARRLAGAMATVLGPAPSPIARLRGKSRFQILVLADRASVLRAIGEKILSGPPPRRGVRVALDMDPASTL